MTRALILTVSIEDPAELVALADDILDDQTIHGIPIIDVHVWASPGEAAPDVWGS